MIKKGEELTKYTDGALIPDLEKTDGGNVVEWTKEIREQIKDSKKELEGAKNDFMKFIKTTKECGKSMNALVDSLPEGVGTSIKSKVNAIKDLAEDIKVKVKQGKKQLQKKSKFGWFKNLCKVAKKVVAVAKTALRLAGTLIGPLSECVSELTDDKNNELSLKEKYLECYVAACKEFDDAVVVGGAALAGVAAAVPTCGAVAAAASGVPVIGTIGGGAICSAAAAAVAGEIADRAYQNSTLDIEADKACEASREGVSDFTDELLDKVDIVLEHVNSPENVEKERRRWETAMDENDPCYDLDGNYQEGLDGCEATDPNK